MLLGLFTLIHVPVPDPRHSDIGMTLKHFILGVKLTCRILEVLDTYQCPTLRHWYDTWTLHFGRKID